jgi:hypothetical protein
VLVAEAAVPLVKHKEVILTEAVVVLEEAERVLVVSLFLVAHHQLLEP